MASDPARTVKSLEPRLLALVKAVHSLPGAEKAALMRSIHEMEDLVAVPGSRLSARDTASVNEFLAELDRGHGEGPPRRGPAAQSKSDEALVRVLGKIAPAILGAAGRTKPARKSAKRSTS